MQKTHSLTETIISSISQGDKDLSLVAELEKSLFTISYSIFDSKSYPKIMLKLYDVSNHHSLFDDEGLPHMLAIRLKLIIIKMMVNLMKYMMENYPGEEDEKIFKEGLQIMTISTRIILDYPHDFIKQVVSTQKYCDILFQNHKASVCDNLKKVYLFNSLEIFLLANEEVNLNQFHNRIQLLYENQLTQKEKAFCDYLVVDGVLKLLKKGKKNCLEKLSEYIPEEYLLSMKNILNPDKIRASKTKLSKNFDLYSQITHHGIGNISQEYLESYLNTDDIFQENQIFDIVLLTEEALLLQIWFHNANKRVVKPKNVSKAYECFISFSNVFLVEKNEKSQKKSKKMLNLCKNLMLLLLNEKKDEPLLFNVIQGISSILIRMVSSLAPEIQLMADLFENIGLICSRHNFPEIAKTLISLQFYYEQTNKIYKESTFKKFIRSYSNDKSELSIILRQNYEAQKGIKQFEEQTKQILKRKPHFGVLVDENQYDLLLILELEMDEFVKIQNLLQVFCILLTENVQSIQKCEKIAHHMEICFLKVNFTTLSFQGDYLNCLKKILLKLIYDNKNSETIFIVIYLYCEGFLQVPNLMKEKQFGVVLNKFSRLLKIVDLLHLHKQILLIFKILIIKSCQKMKAQHLLSRKCKTEPGQLIFLKIIYTKINENLAESDKAGGADLQFLTFSLFQVYSMNGREEDVEGIIENNEKIERMFISSVVVSDKMKVRLMRKTIRKSLSLGIDPDIPLEDLRILIQSAETLQEGSVFAGYIVNMYGEAGKKMLLLLSKENERIASFLLESNLL